MRNRVVAGQIETQIIEYNNGLPPYLKAHIEINAGIEIRPNLTDAERPILEADLRRSIINSIYGDACHTLKELRDLVRARGNYVDTQISGKFAELFTILEGGER
jgi:hypothetical protein